MEEQLQPIRLRSVVAFDCETTGLHVEKGHNIIEIALVKHNPDGSCEEWSTLIKPTKRIAPSNQAIHGISPSMVQDAPTFDQIYAELQAFIKDCVLVAHNAKFDIGFLVEEAKRNNLEQISDAQVIDTLKLSRRFFGFPRNNLSVVAHRFHLMTPHAHRALPDARNTMHIFWAMLDDIEARAGKKLTVTELQELCEKYHKRGEYKKNIAKTIGEAKKQNRRISIDYISKDPSKPIRTTRELEITKWSSPHLEANCLLRGEPRRFHLKQIQRAEMTSPIEFIQACDQAKSDQTETATEQVPSETSATPSQMDEKSAVPTSSIEPNNTSQSGASIG